MPKKEIQKVEVLKENLDALADNIAALSEIGKMIEKCRLKEEIMIVLLARMSNVRQDEVRRILANLPLLEKRYLKPKK